MTPPTRERLKSWQAETAIVLGSGLGSVAGKFSADEAISYAEFPELPVGRVSGHAGQFCRGLIGQTPVIFAQGRAHLYEGHSPAAVAAGVRLLHAVGIRRMIFTNAAGILNQSYELGRWMLIRDHLNLTGVSPLTGPEFIDMQGAYSSDLQLLFRTAADRLGLKLFEGIYAAIRGPQYETPAEVRMLRFMSADAIGMSTALEVIQARALGIEVAGFSCLTNYAAGLSQEDLSHEDVLHRSAASAGEFITLLGAALGAPQGVAQRG